MNNDYQNLIRLITLSQNAVFYEVGKSMALTRVDIEILSYASTRDMFNAYQVRKYFPNINPQRIARTVKKLIAMNALEQVGRGANGRFAVYMLTINGNEYLDKYLIFMQCKLGQANQ
jgi:hypothetical protein